MSITSFQLMVLLNSSIFFLFYIFADFLFSSPISPEWEVNGEFKLPTTVVDLSRLSFSCLSFCFIYCEICCCLVHRMAVSSLWINPICQHVISLFAHGNFLCSEVYFDINIATSF